MKFEVGERCGGEGGGGQIDPPPPNEKLPSKIPVLLVLRQKSTQTLL